MTNQRLADLYAILLIFAVPLLLFAPVVLGAKTLLPVDRLFVFEPFRSAAGDLGIEYPQNHLIADLILQNYPWKQFIANSLDHGQIPLWNPYLFAGHPFWANGQHSALYPLSILFDMLPLPQAFGVFTWLQLGMAGAFVYIFARTLNIGRLGALIAGITFEFSGFMVVSVVHPMIIAGSSWLPFILAMIELIIQRRSIGRLESATLLWALLGAAGLGCQMLAGHGENTYFVLLVTSAYILWRMVAVIRSPAANALPVRKRVLEAGGAVMPIVLMLGLGFALGAIQFLPLYEVASSSFRDGQAAASLNEVLSWAYQPRRLITFAIPNFFGNPSHHTYLDVFTWTWRNAPSLSDGQYIYWDEKNYVEGGAYLGLLPLFLAVLSIMDWLKSRFAFPWRPLCYRCHTSITTEPPPSQPAHHAIPFFAALAMFSLSCIYGTRVYALVYALPFLKQSHSPFRWVFPLTIAIAILAGFGIDTIRASRKRINGKHVDAKTSGVSFVHRIIKGVVGTSPIVFFSSLGLWGAGVLLAGIIVSRLLFEQLEPAITKVFLALAQAPLAFPDARAFYSYEIVWITQFGLLLAATAVVLRSSLSSAAIRHPRAWGTLAVGVLVLDLFSFGKGFNPAIDPKLLNYTPPVVDFLKTDSTLWRYATYVPPGEAVGIMNPNVGMLFELQSVEGYDSLFSNQYASYMALIEEQRMLLYNIIGSFRSQRSLDSPLLDLLNVKYLLTTQAIADSKYRLVYQDDAGRVYQNLEVMPRAFTLPLSATVQTNDFAEAVQSYDPRQYVIVDSSASSVASSTPQRSIHLPQSVSHYAANEVHIDVLVTEPSWLILADTYSADWRVYIKQINSAHNIENEGKIVRVNGNFRGVTLDPGRWTVRFSYQPQSLMVGLTFTLLAVLIGLLLSIWMVYHLFIRLR